MVDESGVEEIEEVIIACSPALIADCGVWNYNGGKSIEHPEFGVVTVRFETKARLDTLRSVEKWEADFRAFIERSIASIESAARSA